MAAAVQKASVTEVVSRSQGDTASTATRTARIGSREITRAEAAYASTHGPRLRGTASDQGPRASVTRAAGPPDQYSPAGTSPNTADPAPTSAEAPITAPGHSVVRVPIRAFLPISMLPTWRMSPSSQ